jgi:hypothetical protein
MEMKRKPGPVLVLAVWSDPSAAAAPAMVGCIQYSPSPTDWRSGHLLLMRGRYCSTCVTVWLRPRCSATVQLLRVHINRHYQGRLERPLPVRCILASRHSPSFTALSFTHGLLLSYPAPEGGIPQQVKRRISGEAKHHSVRGLQSVGFGSPKSTTRLSLKAFYGLPWPLGLHARPQMGPF